MTTIGSCSGFGFGGAGADAAGLVAELVAGAGRDSGRRPWLFDGAPLFPADGCVDLLGGGAAADLAGGPRRSSRRPPLRACSLGGDVGLPL